ncbi:hypothetical protein F5B21DRAFT_526056 [Xylaria acuta]|nr:hypothetical protein F5B21DRAFT_526056 [Xylaria acuta]
MTFLTQYYRALVLRKFRVACIVFMIVIGSWSLSQLFISLFICVPISGFWDMSINARCIPIPLQWYINAAGNIATDILIFVLPLPVLARLSLPKAQKYSLVGIFSLGFFTCAISVVRIKFLKQGVDFSYENIDSSIWSLTELVMFRGNLRIATNTEAFYSKIHSNPRQQVPEAVRVSSATIRFPWFAGDE